MALKDELYARAPILLQHVAVSAFGYRWRQRRLGGIFPAEVKGFVARERFSADEWRDWQTANLRQVLRSCLESVPHYQDAFRGALALRDIDDFDLTDLPSLPQVEKEQVRREPERFLIGGRVPKGAVVCPTSGSTGTPVRTFWTDSDFQRSLALREARGCLPAGVSYSQPRATFSGRLVVPPTQRTPPFHRFNLFERQVYFSAFHLSPANAAAYRAALVDHEIVWGTGYTHAWEQLARMVLEQGLAPPPSLRAIITTSEPLTAEGRRCIERAFGCRVFQEYGMVEEVAWACEGIDGRMRLSPDAGILEVLAPNGKPTTAGDPGEAVGTGFIRRHQLLVRYRLGDVVALAPGVSAAEPALPVIASIVGRLEDVVVGPDGKRTARFHGIFTELAGCREAQVIQTAPDHLRIRLVADTAYGPASENEIHRRIAARFGAAMRATIERVETIPRTRAGKYRAVVNLMTHPTALDGER